MWKWLVDKRDDYLNRDLLYAHTCFVFAPADKRKNPFMAYLSREGNLQGSSVSPGSWWITAPNIKDPKLLTKKLMCSVEFEDILQAAMDDICAGKESVGEGDMERMNEHAAQKLVEFEPCPEYRLDEYWEAVEIWAATKLTQWPDRLFHPDGIGGCMPQ